MESRKRGRDESGEPSDKRARGSQPELRILVEQEKVSHVIGKAGAIIKSIIKQSGAYVTFSPPKEGTNKQVGALIGALECIGVALELIVYQLSKYQTMDSKTQSLTLLVPSSQVGLIIGKQGSLVRQVQAQTGARVTISARPESTEASVEQEVIVAGSPSAIAGASRILLGNLYQQHVPSAMPHPFPVAPPPFPIAPAPFWPQPALAPPRIVPGLKDGELEVRFALRPNEVSRIIGKGGSGVQSLTKQAHVKLLFDKQVQASIGGGPAQIGTLRGDVSSILKALELIVATLSTPAAPTGSETSPEPEKKDQKVRVLLMVPSQLIGLLLGPKGARLKDTKSKSGANIVITGRGDAIWDHVSSVALQAAVVEGDGDQVGTAVKAIVSQLDEARNSRGRKSSSSSSSSDTVVGA